MTARSNPGKASSRMMLGGAIAGATVALALILFLVSQWSGSDGVHAAGSGTGALVLFVRLPCVNAPGAPIFQRPSAIQHSRSSA